MYKVRLLLEYNGAKFAGWQVQPGQRTIQESLQNALSTVLREPIVDLTASGRTDAGVHAIGQVVHFTVRRLDRLIKIQPGISAQIPGEVSVRRTELVPLNFHARYSASSKLYSYRILNRASRPTIQTGFVWHLPMKLNLSRLQEGASSLVGEHDFKSFQCSGGNVKNTVRTVQYARWSCEGELLIFSICGSGFLKQMVRTIVGTLVAHARNELPHSPREVLQLRNRESAGPTAPAHGLFLERVHYPEFDCFHDDTRCPI